MAALLRLLPERVARIFDVEPNDILPRDHDRTDLAVREREDAFDEATLGSEEHTRASSLRDERPNIVFRHGCLWRGRQR